MQQRRCSDVVLEVDIVKLDSSEQANSFDSLRIAIRLTIYERCSICHVNSSCKCDHCSSNSGSTAANNCCFTPRIDHTQPSKSRCTNPLGYFCLPPAPLLCTYCRSWCDILVCIEAALADPRAAQPEDRLNSAHGLQVSLVPRRRRSRRRQCSHRRQLLPSAPYPARPQCLSHSALDRERVALRRSNPCC